MIDAKYACFLGSFAIGAAACSSAGPDPAASATRSIHLVDVPSTNSGVQSIAADADAFYVAVTGAAGPGTGRQIVKAPKSGAPSTVVVDGAPAFDASILAVDATRVLWVEPMSDPSTPCVLKGAPKTGGTPTTIATLTCTSTSGPNSQPTGLVVSGNDAWIAIGGGWFPPWAFNGGAGAPTSDGVIVHVDLTKTSANVTTVATARTQAAAASTLVQDSDALYFFVDATSTTPGSNPLRVSVMRLPKTGGVPTAIVPPTPLADQAATGPIAVEGSDVWYILNGHLYRTTTSGGAVDDLGISGLIDFTDVGATHGQAFVTRVPRGNQGDGVEGNSVYHIDGKSPPGVVQFASSCGGGGSNCNGDPSAFAPSRVFADGDVVWLVASHQIIGWDRGAFP